MVRKIATELKVGLFVSAGLLLAMVIIFALGSENRFFKRQYSLYSYFDSISGLRVGAPVQLAGVKVGYVDEIRFASDPARKTITVVMRIDKSFQERIRTDSTASIETQGLLGDKYIYISVGSEEQPAIEDGGILPTTKTTSIFALADKAGQIMDDIGQAAESLNEILTSVSGKKETGDIKAIVQSIRHTVEQIEKGKGLAHAIIYDPEGEDVIASLSETMKSVKGIAKDVDEEAKGQVGGLITNLRYASSDLRQILDSIRRGEGTLGKLIMDPSVYNDLQALVGRANRNKLLRAVIRQTVRENEQQELNF